MRGTETAIIFGIFMIIGILLSNSWRK